MKPGNEARWPGNEAKWQASLNNTTLLETTVRLKTDALALVALTFS